MSETSTLIFFAVLLEAIRNDDVDAVINYQSANPQLFELATKELGENPFLVASKFGSRLVTEQMARQNPKIITMKSKNGYNALHWACARGDLPLVEVLVHLEPKLCLTRDKSLMTPLQTAVVNGHTNVLKPLIQACPESVQRMTRQRETVFHLAAKNGHSDAFEALLEEIKQLDRNLLHRKDVEGNNVLHIATSNKLSKVVRMLLPVPQTPRSTIGPNLVRVNSLNKTGLTALDMCYQNSWDTETKEIYDLLQHYGALQASSLLQRTRLRWSYDTKNITLVVLGVVSGAVFTSVCNLPNSFLKNISPADTMFHAADLFQGNLPNVFYLMVADTAIMVVCCSAIVVLTWSIPFRALLLFVTVALGIVYGILVNNLTPKFWVSFGTHREIFSSVLVWVMAIAFIGFWVIAYHAVRLALLGLSNFANRIFMRTTWKLPCSLCAPIYSAGK